MTQTESRKGILWKIALPVIIGIGVVIWLFYNEFNPDAIRQVKFTWHAWAGIIFALVAVLGRDGGMTWRFRVLTDRELPWRRAVNVTMLCEFTSAITPSSVGGSALSMFFLNNEGIKMGRATTLTMTILLLDELFFVVFSPLIFLFVPYGDIFAFDDGSAVKGIRAAFWIGYGLIFIWTAVLFLGILVRPTAIRRLLVSFFSIKILHRWLPDVTTLADNMVETSHEIRKRSAGWWIEAFAATSLSWISRYLVVNALIWGFVPMASQSLVFARQFVVWVLLMFSPTPGGSGVSEWLFKAYYGDMITGGGVVMVLALMWRLLTYYIYLIIGLFLLPSFFKRKK